MPDTTATTSLWSRLKALVFNYLGIVPKLVDHLIAATNEMDNVTPSSARVYGGLIFAVVLFLQVVIIGTLCWKILRFDMTLTQGPALLTILTKVLLVFLLWAILFDVGTALSLYGINIWKYISAIRCGQMPSNTSDDSLDAKLPTVSEVITDVKTEAAAAPASATPQATPPPGVVG